MTALQPLIGFGQVRHARLRPVRSDFTYPTFFLMLPMRSLRANGGGALAVNRPALVAFRDRDHGDSRGPQEGGALAWLDETLVSEGIDDATGEVWLQTYPSVLGHTFKPVSFWYCHDAEGDLRAVLAEVHNTFGERHCYLLDRPRWGVTLFADKAFHVSPFCKVIGHYRFRFMRTGGHGAERIVARVDHHDDAGPLIETSISGTLEAATSASLRRAFWGYPALTFGIVARIHWQALKLWLRRVPFWRKPAPPCAAGTRQTFSNNSGRTDEGPHQKSDIA